MNTLWRSLSSQILNFLKQKPILYVEDSEQQYAEELLRKPRMVRVLPNSCLDEHRFPLFRDLTTPNRIYLSLNYENDEAELLKMAFDLKDIEDMRMFRRVKKDLEAHDSKMKDGQTDESWHSRAADLISSILTRSPDIKKLIMTELDIVPLSDGTWVKPSIGDLHFPSRRGPPIPNDLVSTVHEEADQNLSRENLFRSLGVTEISPREVTDRIWNAYSRGNDTGLDIVNSKEHLSYLYWHHTNLQDDGFSTLWVYDNRMKRVRCQNRVIYLPSTDSHGPNELLKEVPDPDDPSRHVRECAVSYLNTSYMNAFSPATRRNELSWLKWLERILKIRRILRLTYDAGALSAEFRHVLQYRPDRIVSLLHKNWRAYKRAITPAIRKEIRVICQDNSRGPLKDTYFPSADLTEEAHLLCTPPSFPFLALPDDYDPDRDIEDWGFLGSFGVQFETDLEFYLEILRHHSDDIERPWNREICEGIIHVYEMISDYCNERSRQYLM
jgi:hypothetical protein